MPRLVCSCLSPPRAKGAGSHLPALSPPGENLEAANAETFSAPLFQEARTTHLPVLHGGSCGIVTWGLSEPQFPPQQNGDNDTVPSSWSDCNCEVLLQQCPSGNSPPNLTDLRRPSFFLIQRPEGCLGGTSGCVRRCRSTQRLILGPVGAGDAPWSRQKRPRPTSQARFKSLLPSPSPTARCSEARHTAKFSGAGRRILQTPITWQSVWVLNSVAGRDWSIVNSIEPITVAVTI